MTFQFFLLILLCVLVVCLIMDVLGFHLACAIPGRLPNGRPVLYRPFIWVWHRVVRAWRHRQRPRLRA